MCTIFGSGNIHVLSSEWSSVLKNVLTYCTVLELYVYVKYDLG
jgi:hypothetical protein